jgi:cytochrome oxidase assembly protein ShyY1
MLSKKKKIIYTFLTSPFLFLTFKAYKWQTRRKQEKIIEIENRDKILKQQPIRINNEFFENFKMNEEYEFTPVELIGNFDKDKKLFILKTKDGEPGYHIVSPFYCYQDEEGKDKALLVDRGWIPYNYPLEKLNLSNQNEKISIRGVIYRGDKMNEYTKKGDDASSGDKNKLIYMNPEELAENLKIENKIASQFLVKVTDFGEDNKNKKYDFSHYPKIMKREDLMVWYVSPKKHQDYANFWITATGINIISNIFVWVFL